MPGELVISIEAEVCCGMKGTRSCWVHAWPFASVPVKVKVRFTGTLRLLARRCTSNAPWAERLAVPNQETTLEE